MKSFVEIMSILSLSVLATTNSFHLVAAEHNFAVNTQIKNYGKHFFVKEGLNLPKDSQFKVAFDVAEQGEATAVNRQFDSLARFINMHVTHGISADNIQLALVIHGKAGFDLLNDKTFQKHQKSLGIDVTANPNTLLIDELLKNKVKIYICGQSAAYIGIKKEDLHSGVEMSLSAMTAHAVLQQKGYTLNPF